MLMLDENLETEEEILNTEDDGEININILAAIATFMRRDLHRNENFWEVIVPSYSIDEFKSHLRMTRTTMEALCRAVWGTGRISQRQNFGRVAIPLQKQVSIELGSDTFGVGQV